MYAKAKTFFRQAWEKQMKAFGGKGSLKNFSSNYPVRGLEEANEMLISGLAAEVLSNEALIEQCLNCFLEQMGDAFAERCGSEPALQGRSVDGLNEEEINAVLAPMADAFMNRRMELLMRSQSIPELIALLDEHAVHEDFAASAAVNFSKQDFERRWEHSRTALGEPLSWEQLREEDCDAYESAIGFFDDSSASPAEVEQLERDFLKELDFSEERLWNLRKYGKSQKEIADLLEIQQSSVSKQLARLKEKFKTFAAAQ